MTATTPVEVAFIKQAEMPLATEANITSTEALPLRHLGYVHLADFAPGVASYEIATLVELQPSSKGVRMVLASTRCTTTFGRGALSWDWRARWPSSKRWLARVVWGCYRERTRRSRRGLRSRQKRRFCLVRPGRIVPSVEAVLAKPDDDEIIRGNIVVGRLGAVSWRMAVA